MRAVDSIRIWTLALDGIPEPLWPWLAAILPAVESERAARFVFERHRRQYVAAHALTRLMLTAATGGVAAPAAWTFEIGAHGKPQVSGEAGLQFNLSHCEGAVVCAVSDSVEIGVDIECVDRRVPLELAGTHFAACEAAWLRSLPAAQRPIGFLRLWTLKEAYIKATGLGLAQRLDDFAFAFEPLRLTFFNPALGDVGEWHFEQRVIGPGSHIMAAVWRDMAVAPVEVEVVQPETLRALVGQFTGLMSPRNFP
jgi:4'-phosphopantetheinyl transferase